VVRTTETGFGSEASVWPRPPPRPTALTTIPARTTTSLSGPSERSLSLYR
jgi:hypothetical protein